MQGAYLGQGPRLSVPASLGHSSLVPVQYSGKHKKNIALLASQREVRRMTYFILTCPMVRAHVISETWLLYNLVKPSLC